MSVTSRRKINKRTVKRTLTKKQKLDRLLKDIEEARREFKEGKTIKGTAEEIIKYLRNEAKQNE
jgi:hypothetical protein